MIALGPGVRVKCIKRGSWTCPQLGGVVTDGPPHGSVWTVFNIDLSPPFPTVALLEWGNPLDHYNTRHFIPLEGNEDISALLTALNIGNDDIKVSAPELDEVEAK